MTSDRSEFVFPFKNIVNSSIEQSLPHQIKIEISKADFYGAVILHSFENF